MTTTELASEVTSADDALPEPVLDGELLSVDGVPVEGTRCPLWD